MVTTVSPETYEKEQQTLKDEIERKHGKTTEQLYAEREKRARDATELKVPDRAPLSVNADPANYTDIQRSAAYYDPIGWKRATRQVTIAFEPDLCNAGLPTSGDALETLGVTNRLWPGGALPPDYEYQFIEGEYMKEDEYDIFLSDPTDFMIRFFLPRMYGAMLPFSKLPPLGVMFGGFEGITTFFARPEFEELAKALSKAGKEMQEFRKTIGNAYAELAFLGFPPFSQLGVGGIGGAPFDTVSSFLRGMKGSMLDMYRQPENLIRLCDMILDRRIAQAPPADPDKKANPRRVGMPLWRGDKSFMSEAQYKKFYWPGLKRAMQAVIDMGNTPIPFFEAEFGDRLESLLELPKGKVIASVEYVDIAKARDILKDHTCVLVRGPFSLKISTPREVADFYKELFDQYGKGGGLHLNVRLPDKGNIEDIKAMLDSIKEHVRY
ncbi:MAG: uroporphyrinogen decarboxylase family protein [Dehalococcoidales bacterium]